MDSETNPTRAGLRRERPRGSEDGGGGCPARDGVAVVHEPVAAAPPPPQPPGHRQLPLAQVAEDQGLLQQEPQVWKPMIQNFVEYHVVCDNFISTRYKLLKRA